MTNAGPAPTSYTRVLLVEHEPRTAILIGEMLRATWGDGLVLTHTEQLASALEDLLRHGATCVIVDLSLPGVRELECVSQIRAAAPDVPIVALADDGGEDLALSVVKAGAQDCLIKAEIEPRSLGRALRHSIERKRSEAQLAHQVLHDQLTGLPNRALFFDRLRVALDRAKRSQVALAVLFLDVDNFKEINDSLGHAAGDRFLEELAGRLKRLMRPMDTVARFGGDEFTFLVEGLETEREVVLIAERVIAAARAQVPVGDHEISVAVSLGIARVTDPNVGPEVVIREADAAMYQAKKRRGVRYQVFEPTERPGAGDRADLKEALERALERSELRVYYQPKVALNGGRTVVGLEALLRWEHPERGLLAPAEFIPLAEELRLMEPIGHYVIGEAVRVLERWRRSKPDATVSVNLSAGQLLDPGLVSVLSETVRHAGVDPAALCVEVPEAALTQRPQEASHALARLKAVDLTVAIDDFGTAPALLSSLRRLPVDLLKVHESLLTDLGTAPIEEAIVGALVEIGHALGLLVIAEGVETESQLAGLRTCGFDGAQGFLFGRPMPENRVEVLLG
jgi:diguanylate cyclase (GGDEF)-like protein